MNTLAIIPARIGSKGIPEKNLLKIGEYTLVERALFIALKTNKINDIIVSTDSEKIQNLVNNYGHYAPFIRPDELSTDTADSLGVIQHSLEWAETNYRKEYNYIILLEPPSPFRLPKHVTQALKIAIDKKASSVVSLVDVGDYHPIRMKKMDSDGKLESVLCTEPDGLRRQDQDPVFIRNCAVYIFDRTTIALGQLWGDYQFGFPMDPYLYGINIDEPIDILSAREFYKIMIEEKKLNLIESLVTY